MGVNEAVQPVLIGREFDSRRLHQFIARLPCVEGVAVPSFGAAPVKIRKMISVDLHLHAVTNDWCHSCYKESYIRIAYTTRGAGVVLCWECANEIMNTLTKMMTF